MGRGRKVERKRIRDFDTVPDVIKTGPKNEITDMPGVPIGHKTVKNGDNKTGVTVTVSGPGNVFEHKFVAAGYVHNGFDKTCGLVQVEELGTLETPIALTDILNVGLAADALMEYAIRQREKDQVEVTSVSLVVGEYSGCRINHIQHRAVPMENVMEVFFGTGEDSKEGDVGTDTGTVCYGLKGGIEPVSRVMRIGEVNYTLGVLVQSNLGAAKDPVVNDIRAGQRVLEGREGRRKIATAEQDQGSIMTTITTDLPVGDRQLKCIIRKADMGIARTGVYTGRGGGEIMIGFTIAGHLQGKDSPETMIGTCIREDLINVAFKAAAGAVNEAIPDSITVAGCTGGLAGEVYYSPSEFLPQILKH